ncbi:MAG: hypothetical protein HIU93_04695 [Acidobacteria bacterium]|nr:hypothetical protein [Acidobacteriota bacterium]MBW4044854.1 hypothetical protein [Acidobacteriota bacterium]
MRIEATVQARTLVIQGAIALGLGLTFFYLGAVMTNPLFEAIAIMMAVLLSATALALIALTDWALAYQCEPKDPIRGVFYAVAGVLLVSAAGLLFFYAEWTMRLLLISAAAHAVVAGCWAIFFIRRHLPSSGARVVAYSFGAISLIFSGLLLWAMRFSHRGAIIALGLYTAFEGIKLLLLGWQTAHMNAVAHRTGTIRPSHA